MKNLVLYVISTWCVSLFGHESTKETALLKHMNKPVTRTLTRDYAQLGDCAEAFLTVIRDISSSCRDFRKATKNIGSLLANEAQAYLPVEWIAIETSFGKATGIRLTNKIVIVPVLRSGLALLQPFIEQFEDARIGLIGYSDDQKSFYTNIPQITTNDRIIVLQPLITDGNTACLTIKTILEENNADEQQILIVGIIGSLEGLNNIRLQYPGVTLIIAAQDNELNSDGNIIPGVGNFGDRYFITE